MRRLLLLGALFCATSTIASCVGDAGTGSNDWVASFNPQPDPPQPDPPSSSFGGSKGGGGDVPPADTPSSDPCPAWLVNEMGGPCDVPAGTECGGNAAQWASYCMLRCCGGRWLGPSDVGGCGEMAPPCP
jgi:hypothetical protein